MEESEAEARLAIEVPRLLREVTEVCVPELERSLSTIVCGTPDGLLVDFKWASMRDAPVLDQYNALRLLSADGGAVVLEGLKHLLGRLKESSDLQLAELLLEVHLTALAPSASVQEKRIEFRPDEQLLNYSMPMHKGQAACCSHSQFDALARQILDSKGAEPALVDGISAREDTENGPDEQDETEIEDEEEEEIEDEDEEIPPAPPNSRGSSQPSQVAEKLDSNAGQLDREESMEGSDSSRSDAEVRYTGDRLSTSSRASTTAAQQAPAPPPTGSAASERTPLVMNSNTKLTTSSSAERGCCLLL